MKNITQEIQELIRENHFLEFGFSYQLFNLSQLSRFLQPLVEARTKKSVKVSALTMNLSRLQRRMEKVLPSDTKFHAENISIYSDLCTMSFTKTTEVHRRIQKFYNLLQEEGAYITLTEGGHEITLIFETRFFNLAHKTISEKPKYENQNLVAVGIRFYPKYADVSGFISTVLQKITLQGINTIELSSTYTELILYIERKDAKLAFETVFQCFSKTGAF